MHWIILAIAFYSNGIYSIHSPIANRELLVGGYSEPVNVTYLDCAEAVDNLLIQQDEMFLENHGEEPKWVFAGCVSGDESQVIEDYFDEKWRLEYGKSKNSE